VSHPGAAVDLFIGATQSSETEGFAYGGGHIIEDLVAGDEVELRATAYGTDCYPRRTLETSLTREDLNQFMLLNFRNGYQRYNCAVNGRDETLHTYMGKVLSRHGNAAYSGAREIAPLQNDPTYRTIGTGTRIFLGGAAGYVIGEGTQHNPSAGLGTLMVRGDAKRMAPEYLVGAAFEGYGSTLYVGLGVPIPLLDMGLAKSAAGRDRDIHTDVVDYGVPLRNRPTLRKVSYAELKSGRIELNGTSVRVSPLSSLKKAQKISEELASWIRQGSFTLTVPVERLPTEGAVKPMRQVSPSLTRKARKRTPGASYVSFDGEECTSCGACLGLCPSGALHEDAEHTVTLDASVCLGAGCGQCLDACPAAALTRGG